MYNVMLDLEALDSKRTAIIVSIGAVFFDFEKNEIGDTFYAEINKKSFKQQLEAVRTFSFDTYEWWMGQSDGARNVFLKNNHEKQDIVHALHKFSEFCNSRTSEQRVRIWGNGVDYDNVVLRDTYETFGIGAPWKYGDNRCYRTIKNMFGNRAKLDREGSHHNGLDDAITQAKHLMAMMKKVHVNE
jgi:hypothetical protein